MLKIILNLAETQKQIKSCERANYSWLVNGQRVYNIHVRLYDMDLTIQDLLHLLHATYKRNCD